MRFDGLQQVVGATIVQEEDALADAPQRRCAEHITGSKSLRDVVREALTHVVDQQIRIGMYDEALESMGLALWRGDHGGRVASEAADAGTPRADAEQLLSVLSAGGEGHGLRRI